MLITVNQAALYFSVHAMTIRRAIKKHKVRSVANLAKVIPHPSYQHLKELKRAKLYKLNDLIKIFGNPATDNRVVELEPVRICANIHNAQLIDLAARTVYEVEQEEYPNAA